LKVFSEDIRLVKLDIELIPTIRPLRGGRKEGPHTHLFTRFVFVPFEYAGGRKALDWMMMRAAFV
jgi:hypothetical protein